MITVLAALALAGCVCVYALHLLAAVALDALRGGETEGGLEGEVGGGGHQQDPDPEDSEGRRRGKLPVGFR